MISLDVLMKRIFANKIRKKFPTDDIEFDFNCIIMEASEAIEAWRYNDIEHLSEELADVIILILGLAESLNVNIEKALLSKIEKRQFTVSCTPGKFLQKKGD